MGVGVIVGVKVTVEVGAGVVIGSGILVDTLQALKRSDTAKLTLMKMDWGFINDLPMNRFIFVIIGAMMKFFYMTFIPFQNPPYLIR